MSDGPIRSALLYPNDGVVIAKQPMAIILRLSILILMMLLQIGGVARADPPKTVSPTPSVGENAGTPDEVMPADPFSDPFDPFEDDDSVIYGDEGQMLQTVADPMVGFNRAMFIFNDKLYFWLLRPVASGYRYVVPTPVRVSVKNFFFNLLMPVRLLNCLLQGKPKAAEGEFGRFVVNTTIGLGGLFNPAKNYPELNPPTEDFGQTLGRYTVGNGFYIVWPLFGPSTLRDTIGSIGDWALNPLSFMQLVNLDTGQLTIGTINAAVFGVRTVNDTSFRIGDYEDLKSAALDPYEAFRNAYIQNRDSRIAR